MDPFFKRLAIVSIVLISLGLAYRMYLQPEIGFSADLNVPHDMPGGPSLEQRIKTKVTDRLLALYPLGSPESDLLQLLKTESCGPKLQWEKGSYARCNRRIGLFTTEVTTVMWKADETGKLQSLEGSVFRDFLFAF